MCGIAGFMTSAGAPSASHIQTLQAALAHRGPDGTDYVIEGATALVHTRLAIIDLKTGDQPLYGPLPKGAQDTDAANTVFVANGEIYNDLDLRADLAPHTFASGSDCATIGALYEQSGVDGFFQLRGMYAIALYDRRHKRLVLARDPFGIKPLYYAETPHGVIFASEPAAIVATGLTGQGGHGQKLRNQAVAELMQLQFTVGADTIFAGIQRVQPGEVLYFERGQLTKRHQNPCFTHIYQTPQADKTTADMQAVLQESVQVHQRSDVPFGMFLSGGIDSSSILALMAQLNESPVVAYTAGFPDAEVADERSQAEKLAKAVGADHHGITVTEHDFRNRLPQIAAAMDDPVADYAIVPTFLLAEAAKKDVTVVLSGEGGDELFGGYGRYRAAMRRWPLNKAMRRKGALDAKGLGIHLWRASPTYWRDGYAHAQRLVPKTRTKLQSLQAVDCRDWLSHDLLTKLDRCLMAHSLEGRTPFLDPKVAAFALPLPDHQKIHQHMGKYLLRQWLAEVLPEAMPFAPKQGFTVPVGQWVDGLPHIGELVAAQAGIQQFFKPDAVKTLFAARAGKKVGFAKWALLFFALWHQYHIAHVPADGDILSVLAAR